MTAAGAESHIPALHSPCCPPGHPPHLTSWNPMPSGTKKQLSCFRAGLQALHRLFQCPTPASVRAVPWDGSWPGAGVASWGSDLGWLHHAHINKSSRFSYSTHLCLVHLESKLGTGKAPEIPNLVTAWSLSTNNHFTHEILSGNKPQITECMSPIWLPEYPCTKDFHTSVLGISWICLYQLCS